MNDDTQKDDKALYARLRASRDAASPGGSAVNLTSIAGLTSVAAWIDRRLSEDEIEAVEAGFLADPDLLNLALDARQPLQPEAVSGALLAKLQSLSPCEVLEGATILPFAPRQRVPMPTTARVWLSRAAIAASLLIVSVAGLGVGVTAGQHFSASTDPSHQESVMEQLNSGIVMSDDVG